MVFAILTRKLLSGGVHCPIAFVPNLLYRSFVLRIAPAKTNTLNLAPNTKKKKEVYPNRGRLRDVVAI